jgi:protein O-GlcNAc transferase
MIPHLSENDMNMFYKFLDKATVYFEYGSGGSTYQASLRNNIHKIYSVESDVQWQRVLQRNIQNTIVKYIYNEMNTQPNNWGHPGPNSTPEQRSNYSNQILNISKDEQTEIDLVFIDGRFRVACCLKCFNVITQNCLIAFDDFLDRPQYHIVLDYYDIIEKTVDNRMVILQKKNGINYVPEEIIQKYEQIVD